MSKKIYSPFVYLKNELSLPYKKILKNIKYGTI